MLMRTFADQKSLTSLTLHLRLLALSVFHIIYIKPVMFKIAN